MNDLKYKWSRASAVDKVFVVTSLLWLVGLLVNWVGFRPLYTRSFIFIYVGVYALEILGMMLYKWRQGKKSDMTILTSMLLLVLAASGLLFALRIFTGV